MYIRDDQGYAWTLKDGRIVPVLDITNGILKSGYPAKDWSEAVAIMNKTGRITGETEELFSQ